MRIPSPALPALALAAALGLPAAAAPPLPQITVTGEGRVDRVPDLATISLGVTTQADSAAAAMAANSTGVAAVLASLAAAGIAERDIKTSGLSLNPNWTGYDSSAPRIDGYTAANLVTVQVRAVDDLGRVLDAAVQDGANTLNGLTFGLADPGPAMDEARSLAVADARRRATLLAEAAGVKLGPILSISDSPGGGAPSPVYRMEAAAQPVPVAAGEVTLTASVTVTWAIAP
jgi:hypothetical protein